MKQPTSLLVNYNNVCCQEVNYSYNLIYFINQSAFLSPQERKLNKQLAPFWYDWLKDVGNKNTNIVMILNYLMYAVSKTSCFLFCNERFHLKFNAEIMCNCK